MAQVEAPKIRTFLSNKDWRFYAATVTPVVLVAAALALYYSQRHNNTTPPQPEKEKRKKKRKQKAAAGHHPNSSSIASNSEPTLSSIESATADAEQEVEQFTPEEIVAMSLDTRKAKAASLKSQGNLAYGRSKYEAAIRLYSAAIQLRPDPVYYSNRAACYANLDQNEKVIEDCNAALKMDKEYVKALNRRAIAYENAEMFEEALQDYTAACIIDGFKNETASLAMERLLKKVADDKTVELMKTKKHKLPSPTFVTAYLESFRKDSEDHGEENSEPSEDESASGTTEYFRARALMKSRNYTAAAAAADRAILLGVGDYHSKALALRGTFSFLSGKAEDAFSDFEAALELDPSDTQTRIKKASIMMEKGDTDSTIREFEEAIKVNPDDADIFYHRGQIKFVTGDFVGATADYARSLELDPSFVFAHIQLGVAQYKLNSADPSTAMKTFSNALNQFPKSADVRIYYGEILLDQQKLDEAKACFEKASQLDPSNPLPFINLALLHFQWKEDPSTAEAMCRKALVVDPECDVALATLGQLLLQQGKIAEAASVFDQSIELARTEGELSSAMGYREAAATQIRFAKEYPQFAARLAASGGQL